MSHPFRKFSGNLFNGIWHNPTYWQTDRGENIKVRRTNKNLAVMFVNCTDELGFKYCSRLISWWTTGAQVTSPAGEDTHTHTQGEAQTRDKLTHDEGRTEKTRRLTMTPSSSVWRNGRSQFAVGTIEIIGGRSAGEKKRTTIFYTDLHRWYVRLPEMTLKSEICSPDAKENHLGALVARHIHSWTRVRQRTRCLLACVDITPDCCCTSMLKCVKVTQLSKPVSVSLSWFEYVLQSRRNFLLPLLSWHNKAELCSCFTKKT